jgi:hypothetical protein
MNGLFKLTSANVRSALVYGALFFILTLLLAIAQNVLNAGTIFGLNWKYIIDSSVIATLPALIVGLSLLKNLLTNDKGQFLGFTEVIPDKK